MNPENMEYASLPCDLEGFKRAVATFVKEAPNADRASLENGMKAFSLLYVGLPDDPLTRAMSVPVLEFAMNHYHKRDRELIFSKIA